MDQSKMAALAAANASRMDVKELRRQEVNAWFEKAEDLAQQDSDILAGAEVWANSIDDSQVENWQSRLTWLEQTLDDIISYLRDALEAKSKT